MPTSPQSGQLEVRRTKDESAAGESEACATVVDLVVGRAYVIGRDENCDVVLPTRSASRRHCVVRVLAVDEVMLRDLESTNGVRLNGEKIEIESRLQSGDEIRIGEFAITFRSSIATSVPTSAPAAASPMMDAPTTSPEMAHADPLLGLAITGTGRASRRTSAMDGSPADARRLHAIELLFALFLAALGVLFGIGLGEKAVRKFADRANGAGAAGNRLGHNPSFESTDRGLDGWSAQSHGAAFRLDRVRGGAHGGGERCLEAEPQGQSLPGDRVEITSIEKIDAAAGDVIHFSCQVERSPGAGAATIAIEFLDRAGQRLELLHASPPAAPHGWQRLALEGAALRGASAARAVLVAFGGGSAGAPVRFDDLRLRVTRQDHVLPASAAWETQSGADDLRARVHSDSTFELKARGQTLVEAALFLIADGAALEPGVSAALAERRSSAIGAAGGTVIELAFAPRTATFQIATRQDQGGAFIAEVSAAAGVVDEVALWMLELPGAVAVSAAAGAVTPGDPPLDRVDRLRLEVSGVSLALSISPPMRIRLDRTSRGQALSLAIEPERRQSSLAAELIFTLD